MDTSALLHPLPTVVKLRRDRGRAFGAFVDPEYVLQYAEDACCDFRLETRMYRIGGGDAILMPPHLPHALLPANARPHQYVVVHFTLPAESALLAAFPLVVHLPVTDRRLLSARFDAMLEEWHAARHGRHLVLSGIMTEILGIYLRNGDAAPKGTPVTSKSWKNIAAAIAVMHEQSQAPLSVTELAAEAGLSTAYFCRAFKAYTGQSPHHYLSHLRVERAKELLLGAPDRNCTEIARAIGFSGVHAFSKAFKQHTGLSPLHWTREYLTRYRW